MAAGTASFQPPGDCPVCGAEVPKGARACPACGSDERSGWNEDETRYDGLDLPESAFEDEASPQGRKTRDRATVRWIALVLLIAILGYLALRGRF